MAERKIKTTISFTARQMSAIDAEAKRLQISPSDLVRRMVDASGLLPESKGRGLADHLYSPAR